MRNIFKIRRVYPLNFNTKSFVLILTVLLALSACAAKEAENNKNVFPEPDKEIAASADMQTEYVTLHSFSGGEKQWEITASSSSAGDTLTYVEKPLIYIYNKNEVQAVIKGENAYITDERMTIEKNVQLRYIAEEADCFTEKMFYVPKENKIYTDEPVKFKKGRVVIKGEGMEYGVETGILEIKKNIKGELLK